MPRLVDMPAAALARLELELVWSIAMRGKGQKLFLQLYALHNDERELLLDIERWFPPPTVVTDRLWSSTIIWHRGHTEGGHHMMFPSQIVEKRLEGKLDPLRLTLGVAALEAAFEDQIRLLREPERLGLLYEEPQPWLSELVSQANCRVQW